MSEITPDLWGREGGEGFAVDTAPTLGNVMHRHCRSDVSREGLSSKKGNKGDLARSTEGDE